MVPSPSGDLESQARTRAGLRVLVNIRAAGGLVVFAAMAGLGIAGLATGHERSGLIGLAFGGVAVIVIVSALARRRRSSREPDHQDSPTWR